EYNEPYQSGTQTYSADLSLPFYSGRRGFVPLSWAEIFSGCAWYYYGGTDCRNRAHLFALFGVLLWSLRRKRQRPPLSIGFQYRLGPGPEEAEDLPRGP